MCDYCPSEFQNQDQDNDMDEMDDGYKRHHQRHHNHRLGHAEPISGDRRHQKAKRPVTKVDGDYETDQSRHFKSTKIRHFRKERKDKDANLAKSNEPVQSTSQLLKDETSDAINTESANYGEYKYENLNIEDHGKQMFSLIQ